MRCALQVLAIVDNEVAPKRVTTDSINTEKQRKKLILAHTKHITSELHKHMLLLQQSRLIGGSFQILSLVGTYLGYKWHHEAGVDRSKA